MKPDPRKLLRAAAMACVLLACSGGGALADEAAANVPKAAPLAVGDAAPLVTLADQHGGTVHVDAATRLVLFTRDTDGGAFVKDALADGGTDTLASAGAVYLSDVSRMPGLVRSMFAMPSLKKRPYAVGLDDKGDATASLPFRDGFATVLTLDGGKVTAISFVASVADVRAALAAKAPAPK